MSVKIDGNGIITGATSVADDIRTALKTTPTFRAVRTGADHALVNSALSAVLLDTVQKASGSLNVANGRWTPNLAGWWQVNYTGLMNYSTATGWSAAYVSLRKNGAEYHRANQGGPLTGTIWNGSGATTVYMNGTTDYLELCLYGTTNSATAPFANGGVNGPLYNNLSAILLVPDA